MVNHAPQSLQPGGAVHLLVVQMGQLGVDVDRGLVSQVPTEQIVSRIGQVLLSELAGLFVTMVRWLMLLCPISTVRAGGLGSAPGSLTSALSERVECCQGAGHRPHLLAADLVLWADQARRLEAS